MCLSLKEDHRDDCLKDDGYRCFVDFSVFFCDSSTLFRAGLLFDRAVVSEEASLAEFGAIFGSSHYQRSRVNSRQRVPSNHGRLEFCDTHSLLVGARRIVRGIRVRTVATLATV